jgi:hypothetical protein
MRRRSSSEEEELEEDGEEIAISEISAMNRPMRV